MGQTEKNGTQKKISPLTRQSNNFSFLMHKPQSGSILLLFRKKNFFVLNNAQNKDKMAEISTCGAS